MDEESFSIISEIKSEYNGDGVRIDTSKVQQKFEQSVNENISQCTICGKHVYQMEKVKAEKRVYHKTCFRCKECNKQLNVDTYNSHESQLYCQLHFKLLFQPKANFDNDNISPNNQEIDYLLLSRDTFEGKQRRNEMIIRENVPQELPPDVVRCDSKVDDGLNGYQLDLSNIKQRFETTSEDRSTANFSISDSNALQRSESILVRLQRYQSAVVGERRMSNNTCDSSSPDISDDEEGQTTVVRESKNKREKVPFSGLTSLKTQWESGKVSTSNEQANKTDDTKEQLYKLRQRICLGRSASMRQVYENACHDNFLSLTTESRVNGNTNRSNSLVIETQIKAQSLREKFEKGHIDNETDEEEKLRKLKKEKEEDLSVVIEAETTAREAKSIFKQMDEKITQRNISPIFQNQQPTVNGYSKQKNQMKTNAITVGEVVKCSDPSKKEEVVIETSQLQERFKFFECYKEPEPEPNKITRTSPTIQRNHDYVGNYQRNLQNGKVNGNTDEIDSNELHHSMYNDLPKTDIAKQMLSKFKQLECQQQTEQIEYTGPKPLKRITPPRDYENKKFNDGDEEEEEEEETERRNRSPDRDPNIVRSSYKTEDIIPVAPEKARSLKEKFENWQIDVETENENNRKNTFGFNEDNFVPRLDITKNLRAKFEAIKDENVRPLDKPKPRVNRFVTDLGGVSASDACNICNKRIYPMEKLEFSGHKMHRNCFKCSHCLSSLRLDNFTLAAQKLYCIPHFKQLFMSKGNYDEGFGTQQHKEKWFNRNAKSILTNIDNHLTNYANNNNNNVNENNGDNLTYYHDDNNNHDIDDGDLVDDDDDDDDNHFDHLNNNGNIDGNHDHSNQLILEQIDA